RRTGRARPLRRNGSPGGNRDRRGGGDRGEGLLGAVPHSPQRAQRRDAGVVVHLGVDHTAGRGRGGGEGRLVAEAVLDQQGQAPAAAAKQPGAAGVQAGLGADPLSERHPVVADGGFGAHGRGGHRVADVGAHRGGHGRGQGVEVAVGGGQQVQEGQFGQHVAWAAGGAAIASGQGAQPGGD